MCRQTSYPSSASSNETNKTMRELLHASSDEKKSQESTANSMEDLLNAYDAIVADDEAIEEGERFEQVMHAWR